MTCYLLIFYSNSAIIILLYVSSLYDNTLGFNTPYYLNQYLFNTKSLKFTALYLTILNFWVLINNIFSS